MNTTDQRCAPSTSNPVYATILLLLINFDLSVFLFSYFSNCIFSTLFYSYHNFFPIKLFLIVHDGNVIKVWCWLESSRCVSKAVVSAGWLWLLAQKLGWRLPDRITVEGEGAWRWCNLVNDICSGHWKRWLNCDDGNDRIGVGLRWWWSWWWG